MPKKPFIKTLLERRIPQILGSYLVAGTSLILFIEYLIEKYQFPSHYPTLALFALVGILPSVVILAYFHGAPGKDEWTIVERIGIPINILFIAGVLFFGDSINIWNIEKGSEEIYAAENIYLSKIRSSLVDMQVFGDSITYKGKVYQLSPISEEQKTDLDNSILSSVLPVLNKIFSYTLYQDLVQNMAMKGTFPLNYDYRYQHA